jgi:hypothetical protein
MKALPNKPRMITLDADALGAGDMSSASGQPAKGVANPLAGRDFTQSGKGGGGTKRRENLLRLKRFRADELKRRNVTLAAMTADVERKLTDLEEAVAREKQRANESDIGRLAFPSFLRAMDVRRENLKATLRDIIREQALSVLELERAGEELKALEFAAEQELRRAAEIQLRRSRMRLDELALSRQLRKQALRQI